MLNIIVFTRIRSIDNVMDVGINKKHRNKVGMIASNSSVTTPPYISLTYICRVELCTELLSSLRCFFAIPTFRYIFNVFYSCSCHFFSAADACLSWSLPSVTEQHVCPHRLPMQHWLKNQWPDQVLSDLCALVHVKKTWHHKH